MLDIGLTNLGDRLDQCLPGKRESVFCWLPLLQAV
jgi:hypothetical protein